MSIKTSNKVLPELSKLEPLDGTNYRRWSQNLSIFFEQLEVDYGPSAIAANQVKKDQVIDPEKYTKDNKTVHGYLLNHMSDSIFDLFVTPKSSKDIWSTLESWYGGDDAGRK
ncbi:ty1-copia retrotransposon protein [Cucumis melo var. makuwa]|uniref:Ty1-copia retrotransposon protein n=1 Tax=Cucumis melo var. makuwa TaxID=1194695 RepID=A0A5A7SVI5_CUCMM|nr:ty1-copia retrotransposon protein [Cucumis melo var. makuwa]